ncbi:MAG TPA: isoprenylcysteine carboxylmethyltransferase family protein [Gemmatimonadales bacterium]|nr:isoprenylcysteine carboxylmethyltransferase family protein [Gemmatimonadales bacterium]
MILLLKNLLFTIVVPGTVAGWGPYWVLTSRNRPMPPLTGWTLIAAAPLGAAGLAVYGWCLWDFSALGRATPFPLDAPQQLVLRGLYRYTRNPMYLGVLAVIGAWAIAFRSWAVAEYALAVAVGFHVMVVLVEEPILRRRFGEAYTGYCRRVTRWLPRWPHRA